MVIALDSCPRWHAGALAQPHPVPTHAQTHGHAGALAFLPARSLTPTHNILCFKRARGLLIIYSLVTAIIVKYRFVGIQEKVHVDL